MATVIVTTLLIVAQLSILRAQYIRHTLCAQLHGGICQTSCGSPVTQEPNTIASLCTVGVCCQQADGTWSQWSAWSTCSVTCGQGERRRSRTCISGICSGQDFQIQPCEENPCSTSAPEWGSWREWSSCSESCGSGLRVRFRTCPDNRCVGARFETQACSNDCRTTTTTQSTVSSAWASWREWESCSATCGIGFRRRDRQCDGQGCIGPNNDFDSCNDGDCSTTSTSSWSAWTEWESCSATCGIGLRRRDRQCDGQGCIGPNNDFDSCNVGDCSTTSTSSWSAWTEWESCSATCGIGLRRRDRQCDGQGCIGPSNDVATCNNGECAPSSRASSPANGREPTTGKNCRSVSVRALGISHVASCQENPWIVYFNLNGSVQGNPVLQPICHGVLLTDRAILTTRICGDSVREWQASPRSDLTLVAVAGLVAMGTQLRNVSGNVVFPDVDDDETKGGDLAIVTVQEPFILDDCALPACLPDDSDEFQFMDSCRITGWGVAAGSNSDQTYIESQQQEASVSFVPQEECGNIYSSVDQTTTVLADNVCIMGDATTCESDFGWMLVCDDRNRIPTLVGLSANTRCDARFPGIFQGVQMYSSWISEALANV